MPTHEPLLVVDGLNFGWPNRRLFHQRSLAIPPGVSLITGEDGCGKSTLLRLLAGDLPAEAGTLSVQGIRLDQQHGAYRERVFWTDPQTEAHDAISAADHMECLQQHCPRFSAEALDELVAGFSLAPHLHKPLYMLSAGSRRKVWLSAAFAAGATVTLIDQPFAALDGPSIHFLLELLQDVADHPSRAWVLADFAAPAAVNLASVITL